MSSPNRASALRRHGPLVLGALTLQALLVAAYVARSPLREPRARAFHAAPLDGAEPAPDVSFVRPDGAAAPLRSHRGHVVLLHFWATWCPPCRRELPALLDLARARPGGPDVLLVAVRDDRAALTRFFGASIPPEVVLDPEGAGARSFGAAALPDGFVVSREGTLTHRVRGAQDWRGEAARRFLADVAGR